MTNRKNIWMIMTGIEMVIAVAAILLDILMPTLLILGVMGLSLAIRKQHVSSLGYKKERNWLSMSLKIFGLSIIWTILTLGFTLPILMRITGQQQDLSAFINLKGNVKQLMMFLGISWTLAAVGEELVYRGYLQARIGSLFKHKAWGYSIAVGLSAVLFGMAHAEQGLIGIMVTLIDGIYFSLVKRYFNNNLWSSVLAHGFNNTIGVVGFFILGPVYSLF